MYERLTKRSEYDRIGNGHVAHIKCHATCRAGTDCTVCQLELELLERLALYEDTEHSPDDLQMMIRSYNAMKAELTEYRATGLSPEQVQELAKAKAEGRLEIVVKCKDCRLKDTQLCRASKSIKYDLRKEKHTYKTFMEEDGFCSIGEVGRDGKD